MGAVALWTHNETLGCSFLDMFVYTVMGTEIVGRKSAKTFEWRRVEEKEKKPKVHRQVSSSIEGREDTESVYSFAHGTIITVFPFSPLFLLTCLLYWKKVL